MFLFYSHLFSAFSSASCILFILLSFSVVFVMDVSTVLLSATSSSSLDGSQQFSIEYVSRYDRYWHTQCSGAMAILGDQR